MKWLLLAGKALLWLLALILLASVTEQASGTERFLVVVVVGVVYFQWKAERVATERHAALLARLDALRPQQYHDDD